MYIGGGLIVLILIIIVIVLLLRWAWRGVATCDHAQRAARLL